MVSCCEEPVQKNNICVGFATEARLSLFFSSKYLHEFSGVHAMTLSSLCHIPGNRGINAPVYNGTIEPYLADFIPNSLRHIRNCFFVDAGHPGYPDFSSLYPVVGAIIIPIYSQVLP